MYTYTHKHKYAHIPAGTRVEVPVPIMGESITQGMIASWLVKAGDYVEVDAIVASIETDKVCFIHVLIHNFIVTVPLIPNLIIATCVCNRVPLGDSRSSQSTSWDHCRKIC